MTGGARGAALLVAPIAAAAAGVAALVFGRRERQLGHSGRGAAPGQLPLPGIPEQLALVSVVVRVGRRRVPKQLLERRPPLGFRYQLSRTQLARLFPGLARLPRDVWPRARCGLWGCVYPRGPKGTPGAGEVIKFTADPQEALVAARLKVNPVAGVLPVLDVFELPRRGVPKPGKRVPRIYAIRALRFGPPDKLSQVVGRCGRSFFDWKVVKSPGSFYNFIGCVEYNSAKQRVDPERAHDFAAKLIESAKGLEKLGVDWADLHPGNITADAIGDPVIIDVGPYRVGYGAEDDEPVPMLAAGRTGRAGRRGC